MVWNDEIGGPGTGAWDAFGQLVNTSGFLAGGVITVTNGAGPQMVTTVAFDGSNYLAVWMDMTDGSNWDMYGQYLSRNGSLVGSNITISSEATNQMGGVGFANGKYLVLINSGVIMDEDGISQVDSANGLFVTPPTNQFSGSGTYTYSSGAGPGPISFNWTRSILPSSCTPRAM